MPVVVVLNSPFVETWTVPANCPDTLTLVECWGAGGTGAINVSGGAGGGGGGAYAASANVSIAGHGATIPAIVGGYFNQGSPYNTRDTSFNSGAVLAKRGSDGSAFSGGAGGAAGSSVGTTKFSGGVGGGGSTFWSGGGGGCAGPSGAGVAGSPGTESPPKAGNGGAGNNGAGGAGGVNPGGGAGGAGGAHADGGGGGSGGGSSGAGGAGGDTGGGSGGSVSSRGQAGVGQIRITYEPLPTAKNATDTLRPRLDDAITSMFGTANRTETLAPRLDDGVVTLNATLSLADTLTPRLDDVVQPVASVTDLVETLTPRLDDVQQSTSVLMRAETLAPRLDDAMQLLGLPLVADALTPRLDEAPARVVNAFASSDELRPRFDEGASAGPPLAPRPLFEWRRINGRWARLPGQAQIDVDEDIVTITDDTAWDTLLPGDVGILSVSCSEPQFSGKMAYSRLDLGEAVLKLDGSASVDVSTAILTGTTGVDGRVTYSFDRLRGFFIENRSGITLRFSVNITTRAIEPN